MTDPYIADLQAQLLALKTKRASGTLRVQIGDRQTWYKSDAEMRTAIASLEAEIARISGAPRPRNVVLRSPPYRGW